MMLLTGSELLAVANDNNFAIPAFNVADYSMFNGLVAIAEKLRAPMIVAIHPNEVGILGEDVMASVIQKCRKASVPIAIHWDHGATYEQILKAIQIGFTSVMIDASMLPFEENVALTKKVVHAAHAVGVSVEGELGTIGKTDGYAEDGSDKIIYTSPEDAVAFVEQTGVDSLAIAIGTCHGIYPADMTPELKLDLLKEIKAAVTIPLVLHGGSNNPDAEIGQSVTLGVNKINISSDIKVAYHNKLREVLKDVNLREPDSIHPPCIEAMQAVAAQKMELFQTVGKADLY
ncbi:MAG: ketose-bisphosphate aldolase [Cellulomonadaceae bacterium]|nr:ketose-bisphosphate aldolase [Cellulomonadaceae bacterium]